MMTYDTKYPQYNKQVLYNKSERTVITVKNSNRSRDRHNSSSKIVSYDQNTRFNKKLGTRNDDSMNGTVLKVNTMCPDDNFASFHTSTTNSSSPSPPTFHLIRKSSMYASRVEVPRMEQLNVDIYSVGVIMKSKMTTTFDPELFKVEAVAPTGRVIKITGDGQYVAHFTTDEIGKWNVAMYYNGKYLDGCPVDVCDPSQVKVHDLKGGIVGKNNTFYVDCTRAGPGDLGVDITHEGRPVKTQISSSTTTAYKKITFKPHEPGAYEINVHFNRAEVREGDVDFFNPSDRQRKAIFFTRVEPHQEYIEVKASCDWEVDYITGGPFICHVTDSSDITVYGMQEGTVCTSPEIIADCTHVGDGPIDAEVSFREHRYPCKIVRDKPGLYRVQFKPQGPGIYKVWVYYEGQSVKGSPFLQEIAELEKPTASGDGLYKGVLGKPTSFIIDPRGFPGQISVAVKGSSKSVSVQLEPQTDSTIRAVYLPVERGAHSILVKIDGRDIKGSPYRSLIVDPVNVQASGGWKSLIDECGIIPLRVNKEKHLLFDVSEAGQGELAAEVQGPNGKIPVTIDARNDGKHSVIFTPREEGRHHIFVTWSTYPLTNSPYLGYAAYEPELEDKHNIRLVQVPVQSSERYPVKNSELTLPMNGLHPFTEGTEPQAHKPIKVVYKPTKSTNGPGKSNYRLPEIVFTPVQSQNAVQELPEHAENGIQEPVYRKTVLPQAISLESSAKSAERPQKVTLKGKGLKEAETDKMAHFKVDGVQANPGQPMAYLESVTDYIPVTFESVRPNVYKCTYVPKRPGAYLLYINWNDKPLKGSPFKVNVQGADGKPGTNADKYKLSVATLGSDLKMEIDPRYPVTGKLTTNCTDPMGKVVPCQLKDNLDGTRSLKVTPKTTGRHIVEIQYDGKHIMGSPYAVDIQENPVKGSVRVWGPGIESGLIPYFQSNFWVDTSRAGSGDIRVRIVGPKGAFHVKLRKSSQSEKIYQCFYEPVEPGIYTIIIQWSGMHVGGSPFTVMLANSTRDLQSMQEDFIENSVINGENGSVITQRVSKYQPPQEVSMDDIIFY